MGLCCDNSALSFKVARAPGGVTLSADIIARPRSRSSRAHFSLPTATTRDTIHA